MSTVCSFRDDDFGRDWSVSAVCSFCDDHFGRYWSVSTVFYVFIFEEWFVLYFFYFFIFYFFTFKKSTRCVIPTFEEVDIW